MKTSCFFIVIIVNSVYTVNRVYPINKIGLLSVGMKGNSEVGDSEWNTRTCTQHYNLYEHSTCNNLNK